MKINNHPLVGTRSWKKPFEERVEEVTDASVWRAAAILTLLRHLQIMLIDNDPRVTYAAKEDLANAESEFSLMVISVFGEEVERDMDALIQAIEVCIDTIDEDIIEIWADETSKLAEVLMRANVEESGSWTYTNSSGLTLSFDARKQMMHTNDPSGDALLALANIG